ncbi:Uncharacterised protein [Xylophilus ampelinus]|nr:Uncharacterised protein [Xylophilus ampelinus]
MSRVLSGPGGAQIRVGRELGKGGEGSVFEMPDRPDRVAKIYHKPPDARKCEKLQFMAGQADAALLKYSAWPLEVLRDRPTGPIVGFTMPKVANRAAIHMVYSPAHRKQDYPKANWNFLLHVARNIAACFEVVHAHGHVVGDVNQNSFMVAKDSTVVLIDTDSFQVDAGGRLHLCEVGVSHFTPPELQGNTSFATTARNRNHDNFGLALLVFHVLFGGRHPYSGVPLAKGVGDALESDIQAMRYAYARDAAKRGTGPPPNSYPIGLLPPKAEAMMHAAFTEHGARGGRPNAAQWVAALDELRQSMRTCAKSKMHAYPGHLSACPWCAMTRDPFPDLDIAAATPNAQGAFDPDQFWRLVQGVPPPKPVGPIPDPATFSSQVTGAAMERKKNRNVAYAALIMGLGMAAMLLSQGKVGPAMLSALIGIVVAAFNPSKNMKPEVERRELAAASARRRLLELNDELQQRAGPPAFQRRKSAMQPMLQAWRDLQKDAAAALLKLEGQAHRYHLQKHLEQFYIDTAVIAGVGPGRKATLRSFGIETAADVEFGAISSVKGFGPGLTSAMMDWRASLERSFVRRPNMTAPASEVARVANEWSPKLRAKEDELRRELEVLKRYASEQAKALASASPQLEAAARAVAQTAADAAEAQRALAA